MIEAYEPFFVVLCEIKDAVEPYELPVRVAVFQ
jgi:hypothetical protein